MTDEQVFELIELALRGEADGTEALDALMELKTRFFDAIAISSQEMERT